MDLLNKDKNEEIQFIFVLFSIIFFFIGLFCAKAVIGNLLDPASWLEPSCVGVCRNLSNPVQRSDLSKLAMLILTGIISTFSFFSSFFLFLGFFIMRRINIDKHSVIE